MATHKVKNGFFWKPDGEIGNTELKEGWILDSSHKCENCIKLKPNPKLDAMFNRWLRNAVKSTKEVSADSSPP